MSVLVSDRTESKFEAITYSVELHDMLIELMQRSFGVKDLDRLVRMKYAYGKDTTEDFSRYRYLMLNYKNRIDQLASMLTSNIRAANSIYPTTLHEYEQRRDYQNTAIVNCEQLLKELQRIVEIDLKFIFVNIIVCMGMKVGYCLETFLSFMTISFMKLPNENC